MNKKALRKELEHALSKSIADTLNKRNALAGEQIREKVQEASKKLAKKFYSAIKELNSKITIASLPIEKKEVKTKKAPVKRAKTTIIRKRKK